MKFEMLSKKEKMLYGIRWHTNYVFVNWFLMNLQSHKWYHLKQKALLLLFSRAFPTLFQNSCLPPKNGSTESQDVSEKSSTPKWSLSMHGTIDIFSWCHHQQYHRKCWDNQSNRLWTPSPTSILWSISKGCPYLIII